MRRPTASETERVVAPGHRCGAGSEVDAVVEVMPASLCSGRAAFLTGAISARKSRRNPLALPFRYLRYVESIQPMQPTEWLARVRHDLVKRLVWPARDRRDIGREARARRARAPPDRRRRAAHDRRRAVGGAGRRSAARRRPGPPSQAAVGARRRGGRGGRRARASSRWKRRSLRWPDPWKGSVVPRLLVIDDRDQTVEMVHRQLPEFDTVTRCDRRIPCQVCEERERGCPLRCAHDYGEAARGAGPPRRRCPTWWSSTCTSRCRRRGCCPRTSRTLPAEPKARKHGARRSAAQAGPADPREAARQLPDACRSSC